jgi:hypothetical protein
MEAFHLGSLQEKKSQSIILNEHGAKIFNKQAHEEQLGFSPVMQEGFNIHESIKVIYHNRRKDKTTVFFFVDAEKAFENF